MYISSSSEAQLGARDDAEDGERDGMRRRGVAERAGQDERAQLEGEHGLRPELLEGELGAHLLHLNRSLKESEGLFF